VVAHDSGRNSVASYSLVIYRIPFLIPFTFSLLVTVVLTSLSFRLYLFGGADAKLLICIALLIPLHPDLRFFSHHFPLSLSSNPALIPFPFAISTLLNASIFSLTVPVALFWYNLLNLRVPHEGLRKPLRYLFIGYPLEVNALPEVKHVRLVHWYEEREGTVAKKFIFGGVEIDNEGIEKLKGYAAEGKIDETIWLPLISLFCSSLRLVS